VQYKTLIQRAAVAYCLRYSLEKVLVADCSHYCGKLFIPLYFIMLLGFSLVIVASVSYVP